MGTNAVIQSNTEGAWKSMDDTITTALDAWPDDTKTALDSIVAESTGLDSRVQTAMGNFYSVGQTAAQSLAAGFKSVHIPSPKFSVGTVAASAAGVGFSLPNVNVSWLAQGGYVKANTPQLAMIGDNRHQGEVVALKISCWRWREKQPQEQEAQSSYRRSSVFWKRLYHWYRVAMTLFWQLMVRNWRGL